VVAACTVGSAVGKALDGVWQRLPDWATVTGEWKIAGHPQGSEDAPRLPHRLMRDYLTVDTNARHAVAGIFNTYPLRSLLSRTNTLSAVLATSTHSPPFAPE
jgi:hypothetical protein